MLKLLLIFILLSLVTNSFSQEWKRMQNLRGVWKFSIGDDIKWANPSFDDSEWVDIYVPSAWEDEGYPGYDGYAWYRTEFEVSKNQDISNLYLGLGFIDDVDEVFVNGIRIGATGMFPPNYETGYNYERFYRLPDSVIVKDDKNVIAVRVFDRELSGGILRGGCGIYAKQYKVKMEISLESYWKFKTGDNSEYKRFDYADRDWNLLYVPDKWENQNFENYDGYAWYRKKVIIPERYINERLVLLMGKIDDMDEIYFNGIKIGNTGSFYEDNAWLHPAGEWLIQRAYTIDKKYIKYGQENLIAVRVFDGMIDGGIYEGPVGIITYDNYVKWKSDDKPQSKGIFDWLFENMK
jgi:sialate O-acetylesterase